MSGKQIKNIIFDLGGVILNIDYLLTVDAFKKLGIEDFDAIYSQKKQQHFFDEFETGRISAETFRNELRRYIPFPVGEGVIDQAWNAMLLDLPVEKVMLLSDLQKADYRLFLLSNTNEIHIEAYSKIVYATFGFSNFSHLFEKEYYSYELGMRKPDGDIFDFIIKENKLIPSETLFIDDSIQHVEGAIEAGIQAVLYKKGDDLYNVVMQQKNKIYL